MRGFYKDTCDRKNVPVDDSMDLSVGSSSNDGGASSQAGESGKEWPYLPTYVLKGAWRGWNVILGKV